MSDTKFTPGPWVTVKVGHDKTLIRQARDCSGIEAGYIGEVYCSRPGRYKPNTALIASAPELYEALKRLVIVAGSVEWEVIEPRVLDAQKALAKAIGEKS